jgi:hypothetical protein
VIKAAVRKPRHRASVLRLGQAARRATKDFTMSTLHLSDGDFYQLVRPDNTPGKSEPFLIASESGTLCAGFFSRAELAEEHWRSLSEEGWQFCRVPRSAVLGWLECMHQAGVTNAVLDPPLGYRGPGEPIFSILMESL